METFPKVEQQERLQSELMIERAHNPEIQNRIIELVRQSNEYYRKKIGEPVSTWKEYTIYRDSQGRERPIKDEDIEVDSEVLSQKFLERLDLVERETGVEFTNDDPSGNPSTMRACYPVFYEVDGERPSDKIKDIIVAHEKGHVLRPYGTEYIGEYFSAGFDFSAAEFVQSDLDQIIAASEGDITTYDEAKAFILPYLSSGDEIAERMSQLKNWLGHSGQEEFTAENLDFARRNYVSDTGYDNYMTTFLSAITPETEESFLRLINNSGI